MLMLLTLVVTSLVGCGCCRRLRDRVGRGAYCGPTTAAAPTFAVAPQPQFVAPAPSVVYDAGCNYEPSCTYGAAYGGSPEFSSFPTQGGTMDSGWSGGAQMQGGVLEPTPVYPGPVNQ